VNDKNREAAGAFALALKNSKGERVANQTKQFKIGALGQSTIYSDFKYPSATGDFLVTGYH
jgi:hypothetical protein